MRYLFGILIILGNLLLSNCSNSGKVNDPPEIVENDTIEPKLLYMEFLAADNPREMVENAVCEIVGDSAVHCWIPNFMQDKMLIPKFTFQGNQVYAGNQIVESGVSIINFKSPVSFIVKSLDRIKQYKVYVHAFTGLPVLWIETEDRKEIISKDTYINANFTLVEDVNTRAAGDVIKFEGQIKGRGNSTWMAAKKPYRLKLSSSVSLLGEDKDKSWVLLANYLDKTMLRNAAAFYMGSISDLDYTPAFHFVEVMMNGRYNGTYQLGDHLKISAARVNVGDDGFLLEIDNKPEFNDITFNVDHIGPAVSIKDPDVEIDDADYNYIKNYLADADAALFGSRFKDPVEGWQKYLDINSFVDWYLINEITKNMDADFSTSCFMNLKRGDKLKMGPLWDFDLAMGNVYDTQVSSPDGLWVIRSQWYSRLFQDPAFVARVKDRFNYFYSRQEDIFKEINLNAQYLKYSVRENNNKWNILYTSIGPNTDVWGSYVNEVQQMKNWLTQRFENLKKEFSRL